jgi:type IV secretion system protein VirB5
MKNAFSRPEPSYGGASPIETPYLRAAKVWDERIGSAVIQARNWRTAAFLSLGLAGLTLCGYIYERQDTHIATYVVPVDEYGRPGRIELAGRTYSPTTAEAGYFVADWVRLVRSKPTDPVLLRQNWTNAYHFLAGDAAAALDGYARSNDPFARIGQEAVSVEIASVLPRTQKTYQVNWRETLYDPGGRAQQTNWTGVFTTTEKPPRTEVELRNNPLGLFITSFQWSREL